MSLPFHRTLLAIERERAEHPRWQIIALLSMLACWSTWLFYARVPVYALSTSARIEVAATTHRAATSVSGRVAGMLTELGQVVLAEQPLLQLDDGVERRALEQAEAQLGASELRLAALSGQLEAERRVSQWQLRASEAAVSRSQASVVEAEEKQRFQQDLFEIAESLRREALNTQLDAMKAEHELSMSRVQAVSAQRELSKQQVDAAYADEVQRARIAELARQWADLEAQRLEAAAAVRRAHADLERKLVRAPISGRIGSVAALQIGDVAHEGDIVATVVPRERLRVVAEFVPDDAVGHVAQGQVARVRLTGFSTLEYGSLNAVVDRVASEPARGTLRVELDLTSSNTRLPMQHGLPARVEVRVDSIAPWRLLLRTLSGAIDTSKLAPLQRVLQDEAHT